MHVYIYDSFLGHKKFDNTLARIETRLTDLGLNGKISRMGAMKNIQSTVSNELKRGAKTTPRNIPPPTQIDALTR